MSAVVAIAILAAVVFGVLSALHVFWAFGGRVGSVAVVPEVDGRPAFHPSAFASASVALALAVAAMVVLAQARLLPELVPVTLVRVACFGLGLVFVLRAVGDFRLVGFFKKTRGTKFAQYDSWLFSPLCLALGTASLWLATIDLWL